jgi:hypothetical protein
MPQIVLPNPSALQTGSGRRQRWQRQAMTVMAIAAMAATEPRAVYPEVALFGG